MNQRSKHGVVMVSVGYLVLLLSLLNVDAQKLKTAQAYLNRGMAYVQKGECERAIADLTQAICLHPQEALAYCLRGFAYGKTGAYDQAMADCNEAIRLDPTLYQAYGNRGWVYLRDGQEERAIVDLNQAIRLNPHPQDAEAYCYRGLAYARKWEDDRSIADFTQAIRLNPKEARYYYYRGKVYAAKGEAERAIADYNQAIRLHPKYAEAYCYRGLAYDVKREERALADYNQAIRLNPKLAEAYCYRAQCPFLPGGLTPVAETRSLNAPGLMRPPSPPLALPGRGCPDGSLPTRSRCAPSIAHRCPTSAAPYSYTERVPTELEELLLCVYQLAHDVPLELPIKAALSQPRIPYRLRTASCLAFRFSTTTGYSLPDK